MFKTKKNSKKSNNKIDKIVQNKKKDGKIDQKQKKKRIKLFNQKRMYYSLFERSHWAESNGGEIMLLRAFCGEIFGKLQKSVLLLLHLTFYLLSTDPVNIESWIMACLKGLNELNRKVVRSCFYERSTARYLANCKIQFCYYFIWRYI